MIRKIIKINEEKCNGCGACASACHEGAIEMVNGKAKLTREDYCDGLGDCLPACPTNAISFEEREAPAYNEQAVLMAKQKKETTILLCGCPSTEEKILHRQETNTSSCSCFSTKEKTLNHKECTCSTTNTTPIESQLRQWPVQIKLVSPNASYFHNANLLIAADCTAYAYGNFHNEFIRNHVTLIGCPKLDSIDYAEKLTQILLNNDIKSITVTRMEVPCCGGMENAVKRSIQASGKEIPWKVVVISADGRILKEQIFNKTK